MMMILMTYNSVRTQPSATYPLHKKVTPGTHSTDNHYYSASLLPLLIHFPPIPFQNRHNQLASSSPCTSKPRDIRNRHQDNNHRHRDNNYRHQDRRHQDNYTHQDNHRHQDKLSKTIKENQMINYRNTWKTRKIIFNKKLSTMMKIFVFFF